MSHRPQTPAETRAHLGSVPTFEELFADARRPVDIALGAALIARDTYRNLDISSLLATFDDLSAPLSCAKLQHLPAEEQAMRLGEYMYGTLGFRGNQESYYDPRNSLLPDVLKRRTGIPITLALVYCELSRRVGIAASGIAFPGHYLVRIDRPDGEDPLIIDPFFQGRRLDESDLLALLHRVAGPRETLSEGHIAPASARTTLARILTNLKSIYRGRGEDSRALLTLDRLLTLSPNSGTLLRERGTLAAKLGLVEVARSDFKRALELSPQNKDAPKIRAELAELGTVPRWLN